MQISNKNQPFEVIWSVRLWVVGNPEVTFRGKVMRDNFRGAPGPIRFLNH
jgi:hypothetical protein